MAAFVFTYTLLYIYKNVTYYNHKIIKLKLLCFGLCTVGRKKYTCLFLHYTRVLITDNNATLEQEFRQQQQDN